MELVKLNNMEKLFVPYELAVKLKKKGFDKLCLRTSWDFDIIYQVNIGMPLWQQAIDWLREEKKIDVYVSVMPTHFSVLIHDNSLPTNDKNRLKFHDGGHKQYYSALQSGIEKALELI